MVFTLSVEQLRINQRIASAALRRANALVARLDAGLSGGDIRAGAVSANRIGATIGTIRADATAPPAPTRTVIAPAADKSGVVFTLSAAQLRINQRIGQAAIRRLNEVRGRLLDRDLGRRAASRDGHRGEPDPLIGGRRSRAARGPSTHHLSAVPTRAGPAISAAAANETPLRWNAWLWRQLR